MIKCNRIPMSIIIVGIGEGNFGLMHELDDDNCEMADSRGNKKYLRQGRAEGPCPGLRGSDEWKAVAPPKQNENPNTNMRSPQSLPVSLALLLAFTPATFCREILERQHPCLREILGSSCRWSTVVKELLG